MGSRSTGAQHCASPGRSMAARLSCAASMATMTCKVFASFSATSLASLWTRRNGAGSTCRPPARSTTTRWPPTHTQGSCWAIWGSSSCPECAAASPSAWHMPPTSWSVRWHAPDWAPTAFIGTSCTLCASVHWTLALMQRRCSCTGFRGSAPPPWPCAWAYSVGCRSAPSTHCLPPMHPKARWRSGGRGWGVGPCRPWRSLPMRSPGAMPCLILSGNAALANWLPRPRQTLLAPAPASSKMQLTCAGATCCTRSNMQRALVVHRSIPCGCCNAGASHRAGGSSRACSPSPSWSTAACPAAPRPWSRPCVPCRLRPPWSPHHPCSR